MTCSPEAAEAMAVVTGEDLLFHARFQLGETLGDTDVFDIDTEKRFRQAHDRRA